MQAECKSQQPELTISQRDQVESDSPRGDSRSDVAVIIATVLSGTENNATTVINGREVILDLAKVDLKTLEIESPAGEYFELQTTEPKRKTDIGWLVVAALLGAGSGATIVFAIALDMY